MTPGKDSQKLAYQKKIKSSFLRNTSALERGLRRGQTGCFLVSSILGEHFSRLLDVYPIEGQSSESLDAFQSAVFVLGSEVRECVDASKLGTVSQFPIILWISWMQVPLSLKAGCFGDKTLSGEGFKNWVAKCRIQPFSALSRSSHLCIPS